MTGFIANILKNKIILSFCFFLLHSVCILSQDNYTEVQEPNYLNFKHHVILAIDRSGSVKDKNTRGEIAAMFKTILPKILLHQKSILGKRTLLKPDDFLSIVSFGFNKITPDVKDFIQITDLGFTDPFGFKYKSNINDNSFHSLWYKIDARYNRFYRKNWTGLSFAGPLSLKFLKNENVKAVNRTFIAILSDGEFNNVKDPNNEINSIGYESHMDSLRNKHLVLETFNDARKFYFWDKIHEHQNGNYKIAIYEYTPTLRSFAIESICQFDHEKMSFEMTPEGYTGKFGIKPYDNEFFDLIKLDFKLLDKNNKVIKSDSILKFQEENIIQVNLNKKDLISTADLKVSLSFWVAYNDDIYSAHELHPLGNELQGAKGLKRNIDVLFEPKSKIFGILPMMDFMYKTSSNLVGNSQQSNLTFWNVGISFLILLILGVFFLKYIIRNRKDQNLNDITIETRN